MKKTTKGLIYSLIAVVSLSLILCLGLVFPKTKADNENESNKQVSVINTPASEDIVYSDGDSGASSASVYKKGGVVYLGPGANYTFYEGEMANQSAVYGGAVYVSAEATFTMEGGTITGCEGEFGGAIYVEDGGFCYINGGEITGNTSYTATIFVEGGGTLVVKNSAIIHDNIRKEKNKIDIYVDDILTKTIYPTTTQYKISESDMPIDYENCCGYFLDKLYTTTIKNDLIDLSNGSVNLYTKKVSDLSLFSFNLDSNNNTYIIAIKNIVGGDIVFPSEYNNKQTCLPNGSSLFYRNSNYTVTLPAGLNKIGSYNFVDSALMSINIPDTVTYIGEEAFRATALQSIYIPSSVATIVAPNDQGSPFAGCDSNLVIYCNADSKPSGWSNYWSTNTATVIWGCSIDDDGNLVIPSTNINIFVDGVLTKTMTKTGNSYTVLESDMPVEYENCCGYFLDDIYVTTIKNNTIDLSNGDVNLYTKKVLDLSVFTFTLNNTTNTYDINIAVSIRGDIVIPCEYNNVQTSLAPYSLFYHMSIGDITLQSGLTTTGNYILNESSMTCINIPDTVTSIGTYTFRYSYSNKVIFIPSSVTKIGDASATSAYSTAPFYGCSGLVIYCEAESKPDGFCDYWNYYNDNDVLTVYWGVSREEYKEIINSAETFAAEDNKTQDIVDITIENMKYTLDEKY